MIPIKLTIFNSHVYAYLFFALAWRMTSATSQQLVRRLRKVLQKWPSDPSREGRDLGAYLNKNYEVKFKDLLRKDVSVDIHVLSSTINNTVRTYCIIYAIQYTAYHAAPVQMSYVIEFVRMRKLCRIKRQEKKWKVWKDFILTTTDASTLEKRS